ncbi:MAG: hypothetical protein OIN86_12535 [Candidatus Methanoperedens sp.]|nr:hypothetical protein [Candidatus Methanoperedens sp.]CAG0957135.1 hypothetical protein METP1_00512 [Methanosarcinales archaeon]
MKLKSITIWNDLRICILALLFLTFIAGTVAGEFNITFFTDTPADGESLNQTYADINTSITNATSNSTAFIDWNNSVIGWWRLNNESVEDSTFFRDWSSWGNNASCSTCPVFSTSGRFGNATSFNGINQYVNTSTTIASFANGTMEAWIKPANLTPSTNSYVMGGASSNGDDLNVTYAIFVNNSGCPTRSWGTVIANGTSGRTVCSGQLYNSSNFSIGVWKHLAITYNGSNVSFYADGVLINVTAQPVGGAGNVQPFSIGRLGPVVLNTYFNGSIDEVRIHSRALSAEEINASYNATINQLHNNFTGLGYGNYNYTAYAQNETGNISQATRTLTLAAAGAGAPNINSSSPSSPVTDTVGTSRTFNITADQIVNVSWYLNGTLLADNSSTNVTAANYTNTSAVSGIWNVTARVNNSNGTAQNVWTWTVSAAGAQAPTINSSSPSSPVTDTVGASRTFNITADQTVNVSWYMNGTLLGNNSTNVMSANYTNTSAVAGTWNVTARVNNSNGTAQNVWTWTVSAAGAGAPTINSSSPSSPVTNNSGESVRFDINVDQIVNVSWYLNGTLLSSNSSTNVTTANYTNTSAVSGIWNVTAIVNNSNGTDQNVWTWTVRAPNGTKLTADQLTQTVSAGVTATYTITLENNGSSTDNYSISVLNPDNAENASLNISSPRMIESGAKLYFTLNVSNTTAGTFHVNVTANSTNEVSKVGYVNTTTIVTAVIAPPVITIVNPANNSVNTTGYVNVTATLSDDGMAQYLNWDGVNYSMTPATAQTAGTEFYRNMTGLLSGDHTFRIFGNNSGASNTSETRVVTVNRTTETSIADSINTTTFIVNDTIEISAPSGNVTVTIPNGTNASVGGSAITNISMDSLALVNSTYVSALGNNTLIGENLSAGPEGARFSPDIQIRFNYTDAQLTAAGITESQLRIKFYNTTSGTWVEQTPYTLNTTGNFITANVSHFSTFALAAEVTVAGAPSITGFAPSASVTDTVGASRTFNITVDQTVNVSWYLNGTLLSNTSTSVTTANYTNASASAGTWNVTARVNNSNGTDQNVWTWTVGAASGAPTISSSAPESPVRDLIGAIRTFTITVDQTVNVSWYLNGTSVQNNTSVSSGTMVNYTNSSALSGIWNVTAVANNSNGTVSKQWTWSASDTILTLNSGWNLVSVPFNLTNTRPFTGFTVLTYNASAAIPVSDPAVEPLKSYWVNNSGNETTVALFKATADGSSGGSGAPTKSISLANGWNMVGPTGNVSMNASEMFGSIGLNLWRVASYNSTGDAYVIFTNSDTAVNKVSDLVTEPTAGYWAFVTRDSMYDGDGSIR